MTFSRDYSWRCLAVWVGLGCAAFGILSAAAAADVPGVEAWRAYHQAQDSFQQQPRDTQRAWEFGRACFDLAEFSTNRTQRAELAEKGIAACRRAVEQDTNSAPAYYYLGLNLGQLARTRGLSALKTIKEMEAAWITAAQLDPRLNYAGPERTLALLYRDAPSFGSVGSRSKARQQFIRAIELAPHYPENRLELIEAYLKWGDSTSAQRELKALEDIWPAARIEFAGPAWENNWKEWEAQLEKQKKRLGNASKSVTPRP
jgi:hypothetical protein